MFAFFIQNLGTVVVVLILFGITVAIIRKLIRDKRKGNCPGCSCGCGSCPNSSSCNKMH